MEQERRPRRTSTLKISLNEISEATKKSMFLRIITSLVLVVVCVPVVFLGGWYFLALMFVASIFAVFEILKGTKISKRYWYIYLLTIVSSLAITFWTFIKNNMVRNIKYNYNPFDITKWVVENGFENIQVSGFLLTAILLGLFILLVFDKHFNFDIAAYLFLLILFTGFGFQSFLFLRLYPQYVESLPGSTFVLKGLSGVNLLVFVILGTIMNDIGAYFVGVLFGKNKMIPRISPNKTWEGFVGGIIFSVLASTLFALITSAVGYPMLPQLTHDKWYYILLLALVMPLAADIGDLFFSATKRHLGIKDYGFILVGHGGILDRIDSLLLVSVVTAMLVILINNNWNFLL